MKDDRPRLKNIEEDNLQLYESQKAKEDGDSLFEFSFLCEEGEEAFEPDLEVSSITGGDVETFANETEAERQRKLSSWTSRMRRQRVFLSFECVFHLRMM